MISHRKSLAGFTLLEVLVALLILLIGLLGIAGLIIKGQRASYESYQRQQALALAQDMAEKIRANQGAARSYITGVIDGPDMPGGSNNLYSSLVNKCNASCNAVDLAAYHLATWDALLDGTSETTGGNRIGGIIKARGCVEWQPNNDFDQPIFWVSVAWQGEGDTVAPAATASACGTGLYGAGDTMRRLVTLRVSTCRLNAAAASGCAP
jgi:type IV pilus assembly protein PilV